MHLAGHGQRHGAIQSRARIPTAALVHIVERHVHAIVALIYIMCNVYLERRVAIGPRAYALSVDVNHGLGHGPVEAQLHVPALNVVQVDIRGVVALPYPWQRARPSALFRFLALAVLLYGHHLQVPFLVERPLDGPIVGHGDRLPVYAVMRELPIFEISLNSPLCHRERWHEKGENAKDFFKHGQLLK